MKRLVALIGLTVAALLTTSFSGHGGAKPGDGPDTVLDVATSATERPAGTLVLVFRSNRLTAIDVASGRRTVRRVPAVAACGPELHVTGGHVIFAGVRGRRTLVFSAPVALDEPPKRLGAAHAFVPSATEGRVWLAGTNCRRRAMVGLREVTVDGRVTFESRRRVPGTWLEGAVDGGLVIMRRRALAVWDPRTRRTGPRLPLAGAADSHRSRLIGCARHARCRRLLILDAGTGRRVEARPESPYRLDLGAEFSPDGRLVATPAVAGRRWSVALVDARDGSTMIVPGSRTGARYPVLSWSASSGWLFIRAGDRILAYRPGAARAVTLCVRLPRQSIAFMAG
jgi:hypothetical protein